MSKQDYELLARNVRENRDQFRSNTAHAVYARRLARDLAPTNPRFDSSRFILACMPTAWTGSSKANVWHRISRDAAARP